ncbi:MAG TPA: tRNA (adenosine(37)-N6)-dimethylallyltransferase MiaA [Abditibacteriaceae bacterium]|nr:tRNA (adenosine(37)-N6)-dimethylallyltransferase MiaA [Abditibacteriaceae bacterium]
MFGTGNKFIVDNATHPTLSTPGLPPLLIVVGPTGAGKTAVAVEMCELLNGEVVSADSVQVYRRCDIAAAKPSPQELARARHHLINIREPTERYSVAEWARDAAVAIADIAARGRQPIIAGGTGFYLRALLQPDLIADVPPNPELRAQLAEEAAAHGVLPLHERLAQLDAAAAERLHPNDVQRVMRAIEIALGQTTQHEKNSLDLSLTSPQQMGYHSLTLNAPRSSSSHHDTIPDSIACGLDLPRAQLHRRLEKRIDLMLKAGFLDELRALRGEGTPDQIPALQGLGYRQMLPALDDSSRLADCVAIWKRDTRRYAKRQMTWFRHQLPVRWIGIEESTPPLSIAQRIATEWWEHLAER